MSNRVVVAYFGDEESATSIETLRHSDVIAVALDLGEGIPLGELRDGALAAGATRCHAFDVREQFIHDALLPAVRTRTVAEIVPAMSARAATLVKARLREVADIEEAMLIEPARTVFALPSNVRRDSDGGPAHLDLRFADGMPFAVNEIPMNLLELTECINTIAGVPASELLHLAYQELDGSGEGQVVLRIENGSCTVASTAVVL
jgi:argininosuccinate synthase